MEESSGMLLAIAVGNTRTRIGLFSGDELMESTAILNTDMDAAAAECRRLLEGRHGCPVLMSSVNPPIATELSHRVAADSSTEVLRIRADVPPPLVHSLEDDSTVGQDRLLNAVAAFKKAGQAVAVVDCGTAITVDFVDGEGTFHGGMIAPGVNMMLKALHEQTAALPALVFELPDAARGPFGKDTRHAMQLGVMTAAIGMVRYAVERFAVKYEAYPQIVATGGDAHRLFGEDEVIEHLVPDLQLMGIRESWRAYMAGEVAANGAGED